MEIFLTSIFVQQTRCFFASCLYLEGGCSKRIGFSIERYSIKNREICWKNWEEIISKGVALRSPDPLRGFKRPRLSERMRGGGVVGDKMVVEISLNRVRRGK